MPKKIISLMLVISLMAFPLRSYAFIQLAAVPAGIELGAGAFAVGALAVAGIAGAVGAYDQQDAIKRYASEVVTGADAITKQMIKDSMAAWEEGKSNAIQLSDDLRQRLGVLAGQVVDKWAEVSDVARDFASQFATVQDAATLPPDATASTVNAPVGSKVTIDVHCACYFKAIGYGYNPSTGVYEQVESKWASFNVTFTTKVAVQAFTVYQTTSGGAVKTPVSTGFAPEIKITAGEGTVNSGYTYPPEYAPPATGTVKPEVTSLSDDLRSNKTMATNAPAITAPPMTQYVPKNESGATLSWDAGSQVYRNPTGAIDSVATWDFPIPVPRTDAATGEMVIEYPNALTGEMEAVGSASATGTATGTLAIDYPVETPVPYEQDLYTRGSFDWLTKPRTVELNLKPLLMAGDALTGKFPFSIPWDFMTVIGAFNVAPTTPVIFVNVQDFITWGGKTMPLQFTLDFHFLDGVAAGARWLLTVAVDIAFVLGLRRFLPE